MSHIRTIVCVAYRIELLLPIGGGLLMGLLLLVRGVRVLGLLLVGSTPIGASLGELLLVG